MTLIAVDYAIVKQALDALFILRRAFFKRASTKEEMEQGCDREYEDFEAEWVEPAMLAINNLTDVTKNTTPRVALNWSENYKPQQGVCSYDHCIADVPGGGRFRLTWKSWKDTPSFDFDETPWYDNVLNTFNCIDDAKKWAEEELYRRAVLCLSNTVVSTQTEKPND